MIYFTKNQNTLKYFISKKTFFIFAKIVKNSQNIVDILPYPCRYAAFLQNKKTSQKEDFLLSLYGADGGNRTRDPHLTKVVLYL